VGWRAPCPTSERPSRGAVRPRGRLTIPAVALMPQKYGLHNFDRPAYLSPASPPKQHGIPTGSAPNCRTRAVLRTDEAANCALALGRFAQVYLGLGQGTTLAARTYPCRPGAHPAPGDIVPPKSPGAPCCRSRPTYINANRAERLVCGSKLDFSHKHDPILDVDPSNQRSAALAPAVSAPRGLRCVKDAPQPTQIAQSRLAGRASVKRRAKPGGATACTPSR
jgi:hypothetical protein